jgi:hypothetical protein
MYYHCVWWNACSVPELFVIYDHIEREMKYDTAIMKTHLFNPKLFLHNTSKFIILHVCNVAFYWRIVMPVQFYIHGCCQFTKKSHFFFQKKKQQNKTKQKTTPKHLFALLLFRYKYSWQVIWPYIYGCLQYKPRPAARATFPNNRLYRPI